MAAAAKETNAKGLTDSLTKQKPSFEGSSDIENENESSCQTKKAAKLDADAPMVDAAKASVSKRPNRKVLAALSVSNMMNTADRAAAKSEEAPAGGASLKIAPEGSSAPSKNFAIAAATAASKVKRQGKELKFLLRPSVVSPTPRPLMLDTHGPLASSTPLRSDFQSPAATTPKEFGSTASSTRSVRAPPSRTTPTVLGKLQLNAPSSSTRRSSKKKKKTATTLKIVTQGVALKFPEALDAMICEATARNSKALYWAHDGQAFVIDANCETEMKELLQTYFNRKLSLTPFVHVVLRELDHLSTTVTSFSPSHAMFVSRMVSMNRLQLFVSATPAQYLWLEKEPEGTVSDAIDNTIPLE